MVRIEGRDIMGIDCQDKVKNLVKRTGLNDKKVQNKILVPEKDSHYLDSYLQRNLNKDSVSISEQIDNLKENVMFLTRNIAVRNDVNEIIRASHKVQIIAEKNSVNNLNYTVKEIVKGGIVIQKREIFLIYLPVLLKVHIVQDRRIIVERGV